MTKRVLIGAAGLLAAGLVASPSFGADQTERVYYNYSRPKPVFEPNYDWSGFYVGVNVGGGKAHACWDDAFSFGVLNSPAISEGCHSTSGAIAGGQAGYRWQSAFAVLGVEAQGDWANLRGSNISQLDPTLTNRTITDAIGLFTGQAGAAWQNVLWYIKGGAAIMNDKYDGLITGTSVLNDRASGTRWGGTIGTGIEIGFAPNWSVGIEYDHLFIPSRSISFTSLNAAVAPIGMQTRVDNVREGVDMATVRVNYRFGGPIVAKY